MDQINIFPENPFADEPLRKAFYYPTRAKDWSEAEKQAALRPEKLTDSGEQEGALQSQSHSQFLKKSNTYSMRLLTAKDALTGRDASELFEESWPTSEKMSSFSVISDGVTGNKPEMHKAKTFTHYNDKAMLPERDTTPTPRDKPGSSNAPTSRDNPASTLAKYIERFRHGTPMSRAEREKLREPNDKDFWWISEQHPTPEPSDTSTPKDEYRTRRRTPRDAPAPHGRGKPKPSTALNEFMRKEKEKEKRGKGPEDARLNDSIWLLQDRADRLLEKSDSTVTSAVGAVSTEGLGSTLSSSQTVTPSVQEPAYRPAFTKKTEELLKCDVLKGGEDILEQWRRRRKVDEMKARAASGEPVSKTAAHLPRIKQTSLSVEAFRMKVQEALSGADHPPARPAVSGATVNFTAAPSHAQRETAVQTSVEEVPGGPVSRPGASLQPACPCVTSHQHLSCDIIPCPYSDQHKRRQTHVGHSKHPRSAHDADYVHPHIRHDADHLCSHAGHDADDVRSYSHSAQHKHIHADHRQKHQGHIADHRHARTAYDASHQRLTKWADSEKSHLNAGHSNQSPDVTANDNRDNMFNTSHDLTANKKDVVSPRDSDDSGTQENLERKPSGQKQKKRCSINVFSDRNSVQRQTDSEPSHKNCEETIELSDRVRNGKHEDKSHTQRKPERVRKGKERRRDIEANRVRSDSEESAKSSSTRRSKDLPRQRKSTSRVHREERLDIERAEAKPHSRGAKSGDANASRQVLHREAAVRGPRGADAPSVGAKERPCEESVDSLNAVREPCRASVDSLNAVRGPCRASVDSLNAVRGPCRASVDSLTDVTDANMSYSFLHSQQQSTPSAEEQRSNAEPCEAGTQQRHSNPSETGSPRTCVGDRKRATEGPGPTRSRPPDSPSRSFSSAIADVVGGHLFADSALTLSVEDSFQATRTPLELAKDAHTRREQLTQQDSRSEPSEEEDVEWALLSDSEEYAEDELLQDLRRRRLALIRQLKAIDAMIRSQAS